MFPDLRRLLSIWEADEESRLTLGIDLHLRPPRQALDLLFVVSLNFDRVADIRIK